MARLDRWPRQPPGDATGLTVRTDPVTLEVLKSYFVAVAEGMGHTLERTSHTTFIKETADFVTALATPDGEFFAYPRTIGVTSFLGLDMSAAITAAGQLAPGDIVMTNDPFATGGLATHLPDIHLFKPVFHDGELFCIAWCFVHCSDVGGLVPASISPDAEDIYQEGFRIPPQRLYRGDDINGDLLELFLANSRSPTENAGDVKAMVAALNTGEHRFGELIAKFGADVVRGAMSDMLDWTEQRARQLIGEIPDGDYSFADYLDDDGDGIPIRLAVTVRVSGGEIELDYEGSDPQVQSAFNLPAFGGRHPFLAQGIINYLLSEDPHLPLTGGLMRAVRTIAPRGTVVNPELPAAVGVRYATVIRLYNVVLGALAQAVPEKVPAAGAGQGAMVVLSVPRADTGGRHVTVLQPMFGGGGATSRDDGVSGNDSAAGFLRNTPIESMEAHIPVLAERYELIPDSAGFGRHRGGFGTRFDFRVLRPGSIVTARGMERTRFEPWGLAGGRAAGRTRAILNPGAANERELGRIGVLVLGPGDVVSIRGAGGGGFGDALARDPAAVLLDVRAGLLSASAARTEYAVVSSDGVVDSAATNALRARLREVADTSPDIDLGPSRSAYEEIWSDEASSTLARLLLALPNGLRGFAKKEVHRRLDAERGSGVPEAQLAALLREILVDLA
jgi:N-methylhydantoinase B